MDTATRNDYLTLASWIGEDSAGLGELLRDFPDPQALLGAPPSRLNTLPSRTRRALDQARRHWPRSCSNAWSKAPGQGVISDEEAQAHPWQLIPIGDAAYPDTLREIPDPPPWLFCRGIGDTLALPSVAIVGSRRASATGLDLAATIAERLAGAGYAVCSGLALGIDGAAHRGALRAGSTTAVLACGVDRPYPSRHGPLARSILDQGCLVSELPPGTAPAKYHFPRRNRIISGLCRATIIVESALPSGTLHTAAAALEQGRDVYTLPWSLLHRQGAGCLRLLRDGATPITSLEELADYFPQLPAVASAPVALPEGDGGRLLDLLGDESLTLEQLAALSAMNLGVLMAQLGALEVGGWVRREDDRYRRLRNDICTALRNC